MTPWPLHVGQAPAKFGEKSAGLTLFAFANIVRMGPSRPVYVAGFERREPLIADWSTTRTSSRAASEPWMSEDLPLPTTP